MIKINLLPFRAARKKENIKRQISIFGLCIVLLIVGMGYVFLSINSQISDLTKERDGLNSELKKYDKTIKRIATLEKKIKEINTKLKVIKTLEDNKSGPVHLLEEISLAVPKDKLWLNSLSESGGKLSLTGTAMDNETVALFMTNLTKSEYIKNVELKSVRLKNLPQYSLRVSDFVLDCRTYAYKPPAPPKKKKKRRKKR